MEVCSTFIKLSRHIYMYMHVKLSTGFENNIIFFYLIIGLISKQTNTSTTYFHTIVKHVYSEVLGKSKLTFL